MQLYNDLMHLNASYLLSNWVYMQIKSYQQIEVHCNCNQVDCIIKVCLSLQTDLTQTLLHFALSPTLWTLHLLSAFTAHSIAAQ